MDNEISKAADGQRARNVADDPGVAMLLREACARGMQRLDAEVLLQALMRQPRAHLLAFGESPVDPLTAALFRAGVERRLAGEPLAYITGIREFWSLPFVVSPAVLVPRPETELLVELCLARFDRAPRRIADLGTGSGAIALSLGRERPAWQIVATDVSAAALEVAAINRRRLQAPNVELRQGSWCDALTGARFDGILSNPPYVAADHPALAALAHEPHSALVAENAGYADLFRIAADARRHLEAGATLWLEHGAGQRQRLAAELAALGYTDIVCHADLAGLDRVTAAVWPCMPAAC